MGFEAPLLLAAGPAAGLALWALHRHAQRRRRGALAAFAADGRFEAALAARRRPALLAALASVLVALALARPVGGPEEGAALREGRDLVVLLDVSLSMLARDHPGGEGEEPARRLDAARAALDALVGELAGRGGHRLSLVAFAGRTTLLLPPALDYDAFRARLADAGPHSVARRGTRIGEAVGAALAGVDGEAVGFTDVVLASDGEDHGGALRELGRDLAGRGIPVHVIALGASGRPVPVRVPVAAGGDAALLFDGAPVSSVADHGALRDLAAFTGGRVVVPGEGDPVGPVVEAVEDGPTRALATGERQERRAPLYPWLAAPALLLLLAAAVPRGAARRAGGPAAASLALLLVLAGCGEDPARTDVEGGNRAWEAGDLPEARARYEAAAERLPDSPEILFDLGVAAYAGHDNAAAEAFFERALETAPPGIRALAHYNMGAVRYRQAENAIRSFRNADGHLRDAIEHYRDALALDPAFADAAYNLELAVRLQDELARRFRIVPGAAGMREGEARTDEAIETPEGLDPGNVVAAEPEAGDSEGATEARRGGQPGGGARKAAQASGAEGQGEVDLTGATAREMTAEEAMELIELVQGQAGKLAERASLREARMREGSDLPTW